VIVRGDVLNAGSRSPQSSIRGLPMATMICNGRIENLNLDVKAKEFYILK